MHSEGSIPARFEQIAERHADNLAVRTDRVALTYGNLNRAANRLARALLEALGSNPQPVALLTGHDAPAVVSILGTLKAGMFYVPINPRDPHSRNRYVLQDVQAPIVVTDTGHLEAAQALTAGAARVLNVEAIESSVSDESVGVTCAPASLAYVMYTSGSTGTPKGVMQSHRNVLHRIVPVTSRPSIDADDRVVLLYGCNSSGSVRDIFGTLLNGAALLPFDIREHGWAVLASWLAENEITVYNSAATLFRHFAGDLEGPNLFPHLRLIQVGSETVYRRDVELYKAHFSSDSVFVARFGSTEVSPIREYTIRKDTEIAGHTVPAGYAAGEPEVLLLDDDGGAVAPGDTGEIAVRSRHVFPGYWRQPELTRRTLLPDPAGGEAPIFLTGDLGRIRHDGSLELLGRKDFQVKIKGHRVELDEVESVLVEHPGVQDAAVAAFEDTPRERRLTAYIVQRMTQPPSPAELRRFLTERLPAHMVPSTFVVVGALPRTLNGKLDRARLESVARDQSATTPGLVAHPPLDAVVARIWGTVLGTAHVPAETDFFRQGGDSLTAMQVISRVGDLLGVSLPLSAMFEAPTIAGLSAAVRERVADVSEVELAAEQILRSWPDAVRQPVRPD